MKLLLPLALALLAVPSAALAANPSADRIERVLGQMNALIDRHRKASALPDKPANPFFFIPVGGGVVPSGPAVPLPTPSADLPSNDEQILAYCISRLRVSGQVQRGGVTHVLINTATYREGDLVPVPGAGETVYYVKIVRVLPSSLELSYNEATVNVPIKG